MGSNLAHETFRPELYMTLRFFPNEVMIRRTLTKTSLSLRVQLEKAQLFLAA